MTIHWNTTQFIKSAPSVALSVPDVGREIAFVGRSNAGKSSVLNTICGVRSLARTSKTPGRTQLINYFECLPDCRLVDLPGYGYAKLPQKARWEIERLLQDYLYNRICLYGVCLILDIRRGLTHFDKDLIEIALQRDLYVHIMLNKADKLSRGAGQNVLLSIKRDLAIWEGKVSLQCFSALLGYGLDEAREKLQWWFEAPEEEVSP